ncbi:hypothetical protein LZ009_08900 [Ramlibacter sp. XY19]|uniref:hypothetical protein n=1 Tax=Ramlibacter paludis TaxID=2908000 RepID=UPI0023DB0B7E|nr:hypothetical protein [Ramlibacter paludis]MCG2592897.1 hypothetical protein [Ramlibacter paludis]
MNRTLRIGETSKPQLLADLRAAGVQLNAAAEELFADERFTTAPTRSLVEVATLSVASLTEGKGATFATLLELAAARDLFPCPLELAAHFRLQYLDQPEGAMGHAPSQHRAPPGSITVASAPLDDADETPKGFYLRRIEGVPWLRGYRSWPGHVWSPDDVLAFARTS